jgi:hypothetical protein
MIKLGYLTPQQGPLMFKRLEGGAKTRKLEIKILWMSNALHIAHMTFKMKHIFMVAPIYAGD